MRTPPKVSVIIPVYNAEKYLRQCLDSVINQTLKDIEIICVDDGSTDSSLDILQRYSAEHSNCYVLTQKNRYAGVARNHGLAYAKGKYVAFLDADDYFLDNAIEKLYNIAEQQGLELVKGCFYFLNDQTGKIYESKYSSNGCVAKKNRNRVISFVDAPEQLIYVADVPWNGLYLRSFLEEQKIQFNDLRCVNDHSFFVDCMIHAQRIMITDIYTTFYRVEQKNSLIGIKADHYENQLHSYKIVKKLCEKLPSSLSHIVLERELDAVFGWYYKLHSSLDDTTVLDFQLQSFMDSFNENDVATDFLTHFQYKEIYNDFKKRSNYAHNSCKVSIIVPVFNASSYLNECLNSLINQSLSDIEIICIDDASTDNSIDILNEYAARDKRIRLISHTENKHQGGARNSGLEIATGKYIWFIDADDYVDLNSVEYLYNKMETLKDVDVLCFSASAFKDTVEGRIPISERAIVHNWPENQRIVLPDDANILPDTIEGSSVVYWAKHSFIDKYRFRENVFFEDADFSFRVFTSNGTFFFIDYTPYHRRVTETSTTGKTSSGEKSETTISRVLAAKEISDIIEAEHYDDSLYAVRWFKKWARFVAKLYLERPEIYQSDINDIVCFLQFRHHLFPATVTQNYSVIFGENNPHQTVSKSDIDYKELYRYYKREVELIHQSVSYRIGRFITWLPRKIRGGIRCYHEHGFSYTFKRVLVHLGLMTDPYKSSKSHKLKNMWIGRMVRGGIRCFQEHGFSYTLRRILVHLNIVDDEEKNVPTFKSPTSTDEYPKTLELGCSKSSHTPELIVSLTSFPGRINTVHKTINTILQQTERPDRVILWLAEEQFPNKNNDLPNELLNLQQHGLEICWCNDIRSYKKLIPTLRLYPEAVIVTADDDVYYSQNWLELLYQSYKKWPNFIHCHRDTKIYLEGNEFKTIPGGKEKYPCPTYLHKLVGIGGVLYPPHCLHPDVLNEHLFTTLAPTNDDIWFWLMGVRVNTKILVVDNNIPQPKYVEGTQEGECLTKINDRGQNLFWVDFHRVLSSFPEIEQKLYNEFKFVSQYIEIYKEKAKNYEYYSALDPRRYAAALSVWYHYVTGDWLNLDKPITFNEKIQWLKLYDSTPLKTRLADKYLVRDWVKEKIGDQYLIPLLGVWDKFDDIDFDKLPNSFVLKANHGCSWNIIVRDKSKFDIEDARKKFAVWMRMNFAFKFGLELQYLNIPPKIIAEEYLENGNEDLYDYKVFCFNGKADSVMFLSERQKGLKMAFYDLNWNKLPFTYSFPRNEDDIPRPKNLDLLIQLSEKLAEGFACVRVDFYILNDGTLKFGEMTFTSAGGSCKWNPPEQNRIYGDLIKLPPKSPIPERKVW